MNVYIQGRLDHFASYFDTLPEDRQHQLIKSYTGSLIFQGGRDYCVILTRFLIESAGLKIGEITFNELVDEMVNFFEARKISFLPNWQQKLLGILEKEIKK